MPSRVRLRHRAAWSSLLVFAAAFAILPSATSAAGPLDPLATPVASILASIVPAPLATLRLPVDTPDPTVRLPSLPVATSLPTVKLTPLPTVKLTPLPTALPSLPLPTRLPSLPVATPTALPSLPIATPTLPIAMPTQPTSTASPTSSQEASPPTSPSPPGQRDGPGAGAGAGGVGNPFIPQGGVSSVAGPHNGVLGAMPDLAVPAFIVGLPLLLLFFLLAQGATAALWVPLVRRFMGGFGPLRNR
jgi:hypothetical protein